MVLNFLLVKLVIICKYKPSELDFIVLGKKMNLLSQKDSAFPGRVRDSFLMDTRKIHFSARRDICCLESRSEVTFYSLLLNFLLCWIVRKYVQRIITRQGISLPKIIQPKVLKDINCLPGTRSYLQICLNDMLNYDLFIHSTGKTCTVLKGREVVREGHLQ